MFSVADFLDRAKARHGLTTDYQLSKALDCHQQVLSSYRHGKSMPDEVMVERICRLSGDDPALVVAELQAMRAKSDAARAVWQMIAARLAQVPVHAVAGVLLPCLVAIGMLAGEPDTAWAADGLTFSSELSSSMYYVK